MLAWRSIKAIINQWREYRSESIGIKAAAISGKYHQAIAGIGMTWRQLHSAVEDDILWQHRWREPSGNSGCTKIIGGVA